MIYFEDHEEQQQEPKLVIPVANTQVIQIKIKSKVSEVSNIYFQNNSDNQDEANKKITMIGFNNPQAQNQKKSIFQISKSMKIDNSKNQNQKQKQDQISQQNQNQISDLHQNTEQKQPKQNHEQIQQEEQQIAQQQKHQQEFLPNNEAKNLSLQFSDLISKMDKYVDIKKFIYTPVLNQLNFDFQLIKKNNSYFIYLISSTKKLIMCTKKIYSLQQNKFEISLNQDFLEGIETTSCFAGYMVSNFKRNIYNIFDDGRYKKMIDQPLTFRRLGTILNQNSIFEKQRISKIIVPKVINNKSTYIEANNLIQGLDQLLDNDHLKNNVQLHKRLQLKQEHLTHLKYKLGFISSTKNIILQRSGIQNISLILGKKETNIYNITLRSGLSPFQAFCFAIAHLE